MWFELVLSISGTIGVTLNARWVESSNKDLKNPSPEMSNFIEIRDKAIDFQFGWFANPIFGDGDYPDVMKRTIEAKSLAQNLKTSRLPSFTRDEKMNNKGKHSWACLRIIRKGSNIFNSRINVPKMHFSLHI